MEHNASALAGQALVLFATGRFLWVTKLATWDIKCVSVVDPEGHDMADNTVTSRYTRALVFASWFIEYVATSSPRLARHARTLSPATVMIHNS